MTARIVKIAGALAMLGSGLGCVHPARCPVPRSHPRARLPVVHEGTLSFHDSRSSPAQRIVVARVGLLAGTRLRTSLLRVVPKPRGMRWAGHLRPVDLVHFAGRRLRRSIARGAPVTRGDLVDGGRSGARSKLPRGARSVTLRVDWVGGAGTWVRSGDYVDVAVVLRSRGRLNIRMLMQSARVLSAEQWVKGGALKARRPWCSLLALPREAQALALAQRLGRLVLFRRGSRDRRRVVYQPVTRKDLESPRFWRDLRRNRLRTIQRHGMPDDPGVGAGLRVK